MARDDGAQREAGRTGRRAFLKTAGVLAVGTATTAAACDTPASGDTPSPLPHSSLGLDQPLLGALAATVLPASLGPAAQRSAMMRFVAWAAGYTPVAEEMHGYGYADIRYLPPDPVPAWSAQLSALDMLSKKSQRVGFVQATAPQRTAVLEAALRGIDLTRLPAPLEAPHVAVALLAHWASSPAAWNLALGAEVTPLSCRPLEAALQAPAPLVSRPRGDAK